MFKSLSQAKQAVKQKLFSYVGRGVKDVFDTVGSGIIPPVGFKVGEIFVDTERAVRFTAVYAATGSDGNYIVIA